MQIIKFRGLTLDTRQEVKGYYCKVEGKHYIILDDAEILIGAEASPLCKDCITGFVEVDPETVKIVKNGTVAESHELLGEKRGKENETVQRL